MTSGVKFRATQKGGGNQKSWIASLHSCSPSLGEMSFMTSLFTCHLPAGARGCAFPQVQAGPGVCPDGCVLHPWAAAPLLGIGGWGEARACWCNNEMMLSFHSACLESDSATHVSGGVCILASGFGAVGEKTLRLTSFSSRMMVNIIRA